MSRDRTCASKVQMANSAGCFPRLSQLSWKKAILRFAGHPMIALHRALHGMTRALINNMVVGVSTGFQKVLEVNGVGYRAEMSGENLMLYVGYSHPVTFEPPAGIRFETDARTRQIKVMGRIKNRLGRLLQISARSAHRSLIKARVSNTWERKSAARLVSLVRCRLWLTTNLVLWRVNGGMSVFARIWLVRQPGHA